MAYNPVSEAERERIRILFELQEPYFSLKAIQDLTGRPSPTILRLARIFGWRTAHRLPPSSALPQPGEGGAAAGRGPRRKRITELYCDPVRYYALAEIAADPLVQVSVNNLRNRIKEWKLYRQCDRRTARKPRSGMSRWEHKTRFDLLGPEACRKPVDAALIERHLDDGDLLTALTVAAGVPYKIVYDLLDWEQAQRTLRWP